MIDFSKIKFSEQQLGTFGNIEISGGLKLQKKIYLNPDTIYNNTNAKIAARDRIKYEIYKEIYGEIKEELENLKNLIGFHGKHKEDIVLNYRPHYLTDNTVKEIINKLSDLVKMPE